MRPVIHDDPVPPSLAANATLHTVSGFNATAAWDGFAGKPEVRARLWPIQRGLCGYCESRLVREGCHIEHIRRKSLHPEETFNWPNLILNCQCTDSCGHFKDRDKRRRPAVSDDPRFIKPTEIDCSRYFFYLRNGEVVPAPHPHLSDADRERAKFTIKVLGLTTSFRLVREREQILTALYGILEGFNDNQDNIQAYLDAEFPQTGDDKAFWSARRQHSLSFVRASSPSS